MNKKQPFSKPPLSIQEQISLLENRGILIQNKDMAAHYLKFIGYYRFSGYTNYFKTTNDRYKDGTTFEAVLQHYIFDRKLRALLFNTMENIEIAIKSIITSAMTERYGPFWFTNSALFVAHIGQKSIKGADIVLQAIRDTTIEQKNKDVFLKHYYDKYSSPDLPPSWIVMETLSMGVVSRIFSLLKVEERKVIASSLQIKERHLVSWMRSLTYTRNLCAHHARVWNRVFTLKVEADKRYQICREPAFHKGKIYSQLVVVAILLEAIAQDNHWEKHIKKLLFSSSHPYANDMGFPENWNEFNLTK
jgi:abortive infection bacteriophage resistance protein